MQRRGVALATVAAALAIVVLTGLARAQDAYVTYQISNWTLAPAITPTVNGQMVRGFLAYTNAVTGSNISVVWYQREADGSWTTWAWETRDLCGATLWVRAHLSSNLVFENEPVLSEAAWEAGCAARAPKQVVNGLFFDDPVQGLVQGSPEPEALVSTLVEIGWQAAPDLSPLAVADPIACIPGEPPTDPVKALMDVETYRAEMLLFGTTLIELLCGAPCNGCERVWGGKQPAAGSTWVLHSRIVLSDGSVMCCYDRPAVQHFQEQGVSYIFCNQCTASGTITTTMHATTYAGATDGVCHPPP